MRECLLGTTTRRDLNNFVKKVPSVEDRKDILLYRYDDSDFCLFFWACLCQMSNVIDFSIKYCNIPPSVKQSFQEMEKEMYECGRCNSIQCNLDKVTKEEFTPLQIAIWSKNKLSVENLVMNHRFDVDEESHPLGITPLQLACSMNWIEMVNYLIKRGKANVAKLDNFGKNTLMYTLLGGSCWKMCLMSSRRRNDDDDENIKLKICQILLKHGAGKNERDKISGLNSFDVCASMGYISIISLLLYSR